MSIKSKAKIPITIKQPTGTFVDGKPSYTDIPALCMFFDFSQSDYDYFGTIKNGKKFIIAPLDEAPKDGARITLVDKTYDVAGIKTYRKPNGRVLGYKCAVAG